MKFKVDGEIKIGSEQRVFTKEVEAKSENHAKELIYALFGAQNGIKRVNIKISKLTKVA